MMNIVVTGSSKGIGKSIAETFAKQGFNVAICARNKENLADFATELSAFKGEILMKVADMSKREDVDAFAEFVLSKWKKVDVLVNNAGVFVPGKTYEEEEGKLELMIQTNLYSAYYLSRALIGGMIDAKSGHVFNISSVAGLQAYENGGSYSISKFALTGFSKNLRDELKEFGVRVTTIYPGATYTASWEGFEVDQERLMPADDIGQIVWNTYQMSNRTVVEDIVLRPQLGDL